MAGWFGRECYVCKAVACLFLDSADWFAISRILSTGSSIITARERARLPLKMLVYRFALLVW